MVLGWSSCWSMWSWGGPVVGPSGPRVVRCGCLAVLLLIPWAQLLFRLVLGHVFPSGPRGGLSVDPSGPAYGPSDPDDEVIVGPSALGQSNC